MSITLERAKLLKHGDVLIYSGIGASQKGSNRWRVNGKPKTWKRDPSRVEVPLKFGLYSYGKLTEGTLHCFTLESEA